MINPQMNLPEVPTVKELWKNEKTKYRHWILLFGIGIAIIFALQITSFIMNMISMDSIKHALGDPANNYLTSNKSTGTPDPDAVDKAFTMQFIIMPIVQFLLVGLGLLYFLTTVYSSYKMNSFAKISQWSTMVIGIGAFMAIFQLFQMMWSSSAKIILDDTFPGGIFQFINYFLLVGVYFGASIKVSRIRREFAVSARVEQLKNDPAFKQQMEMYQNMMKNGMQPGAMGPMGMNMGPMGPMAPQPQNQTPQNNQTSQTPQNNQTQQNTIQQPPKPEISKDEKDLNNMTIVQLKDVAKELSISGINTMKKQEIIKAILRVTQK